MLVKFKIISIHSRTFFFLLSHSQIASFTFLSSKGLVGCLLSFAETRSNLTPRSLLFSFLWCTYIDKKKKKNKKNTFLLYSVQVPSVLINPLPSNVFAKSSSTFEKIYFAKTNLWWWCVFYVIIRCEFTAHKINYVFHKT